jgi:hypothetical protein
MAQGHRSPGRVSMSMAKGLAGQHRRLTTSVAVRTMAPKNMAAKSVDANASGGTRLATPQ